ncbi:MAG: hypothetical protein LC808_24650, partial [Actinobacteria bacterium]|nr:hypothetical protein [Actinomycetota bacterium]
MMRRWVLGGFAPLLLLVGGRGFVTPGSGATSTAPAYNVFQLTAGAVGSALVLRGDRRAIRCFTVGFGLLDLYQALASRRHWFPEAWFRWTPADDRQHVVLGA